jgi:hypothetical protein
VGVGGRRVIVPESKVDSVFLQPWIVRDRQFAGIVFAVECGSKDGRIISMDQEAKLYDLFVA